MSNPYAGYSQQDADFMATVCSLIMILDLLKSNDRKAVIAKLADTAFDPGAVPPNFDVTQLPAVARATDCIRVGLERACRMRGWAMPSPRSRRPPQERKRAG